MSVEEFFKLFLDELKQNSGLWGYYKFLEDRSSFGFRKSYFIQRLQYITNHITDKSSVIWDCGSGYGTTCIFLALNGFKTSGSTLEFYYKDIPKRLEYWSKYGDMDLITTNYENIFDSHPDESSTDIIILQDTLHHLEPMQDALKIFYKILKPDGKIILIEENGANIIQNIKLYKQRGSKRIIEFYDERLKKNIIMGDENIRSLKKWRKEFAKQNFKIIEPETQYIRFFPPFKFNDSNTNQIINKEQQLWKKYPLLKKYFFFGINFIVEKQI